MVFIFFIILLVLLLLGGFCYLLFKKGVPFYQMPFAVIYILWFLLFLLASSLFGEEYPKAIDPREYTYTFLSEAHRLTFVVYFFLYHIALCTLWIRKAKLPPLPLVCFLCLLYIGIATNIVLASQLLGGEHPDQGSAFFCIYSAFMAIAVIGQTLMNVREQLSEKTFKFSWLNKLNTLLSSRFSVLTWSVILVFPIFVLITLLLMLLGQDYDSVVKGFTETTTWRFSQHDHPPYEYHSGGHYLCTVAACGSPRLVKPLRWGKRGGRRIVVNRQIQIANAFEELIADFSPKFHHWIRTCYDKYGYDLSKKIRTKTASNIVYLLMKPLEWFFLFCLYTFSLHPEQKIERQYAE